MVSGEGNILYDGGSLDGDVVGKGLSWREGTDISA